ncbi:MAG: hypothetical protein J0G29_00875 [Alphaproteobacteria bacterium]|nr:hypothetical protein [Alphaproteobacteria bacterium]
MVYMKRLKKLTIVLLTYHFWVSCIISSLVPGACYANLEPDVVAESQKMGTVVSLRASTQLQTREFQPPGRILYKYFDPDLNAFYLVYGGAIDNELDYFVPGNPVLIQNLWFIARDIIASQIGVVSPTRSDAPETAFWANSACTVQDLFSAATRNVNGFMAKFRNIASQVPGARVSFGPGDQFAQKSLESLTRKINQMIDEGVEFPVKKVNDALRGTIIIGSPGGVAQIIPILNRNFPNNAIIFSNKFAQTYASGYVGIHGSVLYINGNDAIIAEMQIHLSNIMDGTANCPKEFTHGIYEKTRLISLNPTPDEQVLLAKGNSAQQIVYLFGMNRTLEGIIPQQDDDGDSFLAVQAQQQTPQNQTYDYYYVSGFLVRAQQNDTLSEKLGDYFGNALPNMDVFKANQSAWQAVTDPVDQLELYNLIQQEGDLLTLNATNYILDRLNTTFPCNTPSGNSNNNHLAAILGGSIGGSIGLCLISLCGYYMVKGSGGGGSSAPFLPR